MHRSLEEIKLGMIAAMRQFNVDVIDLVIGIEEETTIITKTISVWGVPIEGKTPTYSAPMTVMPWIMAPPETKIIRKEIKYVPIKYQTGQGWWQNIDNYSVVHMDPTRQNYTYIETEEEELIIP